MAPPTPGPAPVPVVLVALLLVGWPLSKYSADELPAVELLVPLPPTPTDAEDEAVLVDAAPLCCC